MNGEQAGELERRDIRDQIDRILQDLGSPDPPLKLEDVRSLLSLDIQYYTSSDPGLVSELIHRFRLLVGKTIPDLGRHLQVALSKSKLCAFWIPAPARIMLDSDVPKPKHRWIEAHEVIHSIVPWHKKFLLGDNAQTLDPTCHAVLEAEANYGAGRLLFFNDRFGVEARDVDLSFKSIQLLKRRYGNSMVSTFWRIVEDRNPDEPVFGLISVHPHYPEIGSHGGPKPWRYFIRSVAFARQFSKISPGAVFEIIKTHASHRRAGPIFAAEDVITDDLGAERVIELESFSTTHAVLTLGYATRVRSLTAKQGTQSKQATSLSAGFGEVL